MTPQQYAESQTAKLPELFFGLDLGQMQDYTAGVLIQQDGWDDHATFNVRSVKRWSLGTPYPLIVSEVSAFMTRLPPSRDFPSVCVDATGVGLAIVDLFKQDRGNWKLVPITITGGNTASEDHGNYYVPKRDLVAVINAGLQTDRLKIEELVDHGETLRRELRNFTMTTNKLGHDSYGAGFDWRAGNHDDLVLATALALWYAKRPRKYSYAF